MAQSPSKMSVNNKNCPICKSIGKHAFISKNKFEVSVCTNEDCGHLWLPNREIDQGIHERLQSLDKESDYNLAIYGKRNDRLLQIFLEKIEWKNKINLNFCDFGAGCAHVSRSIKQKLGDQVTIFCIEGNERVRKFYPKWGLKEIENIKTIKDETIDIIYAVEVIEHLDQPVSTMSQLHRKLKKNGKIFLSTPHGSINEWETNAYDNPTHVQFFTDRSLNLLLENSGFTALDQIDERILIPKEGDQGPKQRLKSLIKNTIEKVKNATARIYLRKMPCKEIRGEEMQQAKNKTKQLYHLAGFTQKTYLE